MSLPIAPFRLPRKGDPGTSSLGGFPETDLACPSPAANPAFLFSNAGRMTRIVSELEEFPKRMASVGVRGTFLVFGSARTRYLDQIEAEIALQREIIAGKKGDIAAIRAAKKRIAAMDGLRWATEWMTKTEELCAKLTRWAMSAEGRRVGMFVRSNLLPNEYTMESFASPSVLAANAPSRWFKGAQPPLPAAAAGAITVSLPSKPHRPLPPPSPSSPSGCGPAAAASPPRPTYSYEFEHPLVVCSGGGPGFMEAANKGAYMAGGVSLGVAVKLPFETRMNDYVTPGLHFQMDYFFTRKFWEVFAAKCMICCPGGMGTCDEMFEVLTLMQCGKCPTMPVVLLGKKFWTECINFPALAGYNMLSKAEVDALLITDNVDEAVAFIVGALKKEALEEEAKLAKIIGLQQAKL